MTVIWQCVSYTTIAMVDSVIVCLHCMAESPSPTHPQIPAAAAAAAAVCIVSMARARAQARAQLIPAAVASAH